MNRQEVAKFVGTQLRRIGMFRGLSTLNAAEDSEIRSIYVAADGSHVSMFGRMGRVVGQDSREVMFALELLPSDMLVEEFWRAMKGSGFKGQYWLPKKKKDSDTKED